MAAAVLGTAGPPAEPDPLPEHANDAVLDVRMLFEPTAEAASTTLLAFSDAGERRGGEIISEHSSHPGTTPDVDPLEKLIAIDIQEVRGSKKVPSIWRVHPSIRDQDPEVYTPKLLSIGPLHHKKESLLPMEKIKLIYLNDLLRRSPENKLGNYVQAMRTCERGARMEYADDVMLDAEGFVRMLVLDGCFIIEYFLKRFFKTRHDVPGVSRSWAYLPRDLVQLENQIPFFVLVTLFDKCTIPFAGTLFEGKREERLTLMEIALAFLKIKELQTKHLPALGKVRHLLHLHHLCLNPTHIKEKPRGWSFRRVVAYPCKKAASLSLLVFIGLLYLLISCRWHWCCSRTKKSAVPRMIACATELDGAGIKFKKKVFKREPIETYLKVSFKEGTLKIPSFSVQESTISELRNFIALEQYCPFFGSHCTTYAVFMDNIINTEGDVAILRKCGIIESMLGNEEVAKIFNTLCKGTHLDYKFHSNVPLFKDVRKYCELPHHHWRADLVRAFFSNPWSTISLVAAIVLLGLTVTQTYFAINPRK